MPVLKHAKKKLRQDKVRTLRNKAIRSGYKDAVKAAKANPTDETIKKAYSEVDKAAKHNIIHENKAARLKSAITRTKEGGATATPIKKAAPKKKAPATKAKKTSKKK